MDQSDFIRPTMLLIVETGYDNSHQPNESSGLLEPRILAEACIKIANGEVERVRLGKLRRKFLRRGAGDVHLLSVSNSLRVFLCNLPDVLLIRQLFKKSSSQDVVDLISI